MDTIATFYPSLSERKPIPVLYLPATFALTIVPFFATNRRRTSLLILPLLLSLCVVAPCYTFGNPSADFYRSSGFIIMPLWFLEFAICKPQSGSDSPAYVKNTKFSPRIEDCQGAWAKLRWAVELMVPSHRGIGWNWQIKNIPEDARCYLSRRSWIFYQIRKAILSYVASLLLLVVMGYASTSKQGSQGPLSQRLVDAVIGWTGAIWIYCRLCAFYCSASAVTVTVGMYERWQLPPLMGNVRDAWSVRQFWVVYHQTMRQVNVTFYHRKMLVLTRDRWSLPLQFESHELLVLKKETGLQDYVSSTLRLA